MIKVDVRTVGLPELTRDLDDLARSQIPFATALALTRTAQRVHARVIDEMSRELDRPTPWTRSALWLSPATKERLSASVYLKNGKGSRAYTDPRWPGMVNAFHADGVDAESLIGHLFSGGGRRIKTFERAFSARGILPAGWFMVPARNAPRNQYGNVPVGFISQMLSFFDTRLDAKQNMTGTSRARFRQLAVRRGGPSVTDVDYFVSRGKGHYQGAGSWAAGMEQRLPPGIWRRVRHGSSGHSFVQPVFMFVKKTFYKRYFDLSKIAQAVVAQHFKSEFEAALNQAIRTAGKLAPGASRAERAADWRRRAFGGSSGGRGSLSMQSGSSSFSSRLGAALEDKLRGLINDQFSQMRNDARQLVLEWTGIKPESKRRSRFP